jgi:undecaprenyl-diphosphatase
VTILQALILGIIQGLSEFLPISSSGHLLIAQHAMGITETGFAFDVALHLGTLVALIIFFYKDLLQLLRALFVKSKLTNLAWLLIIATLPAAIIGYLLESAAESRFRSVTLVMINFALFGLVMLGAEAFARRYKNQKKIDDVTLKEALTMGFAQALAIVPGVSRSGATISAGLFTGLDRVSATRFSFLLGIPITAGAILKVLVSNSALTQINNQTGIFVTGVLTAFVTGLFAIRFMLNYLGKHSLAVFAYYRFIVAALVLLALVLF